jgi:hypothetical protein
MHTNSPLKVCWVYSGNFGSLRSAHPVYSDRSDYAEAHFDTAREDCARRSARAGKGAVCEDADCSGAEVAGSLEAARGSRVLLRNGY